MELVAIVNKKIMPMITCFYMDTIDAVNRLQKHQTSAPESGNMYGHDPRLDASLAAKKFYTQRNM
jgi:hypothetical protein